MLFSTAKGVVQKEVVYFGFPKQEVALFQRQAGEDKSFSHFNHYRNDVSGALDHES